MPNEFGLLLQVLADCVPSVVVAITSGENNYADLHSFDSRPKVLCGGRSGRSGLLAGCTPFFHGGLAIALFESGQSHGGDEFLLTMIVEFDYNVIVITGDN
jgi:hypothetical protein